MLRRTVLWKSNIDTKHDNAEWNSSLITKTRVLERVTSIDLFFSGLVFWAQNITRMCETDHRRSEAREDGIEAFTG